MTSRRLRFPVAVAASLTAHALLAMTWIGAESAPPPETREADAHAVAMTGESFDISATDEPADEPADPSPAFELPATTPAASASGAETNAASDDGVDARPTVAHPAARTSAGAATPASTSNDATSAAAAPATASFGAVGERGAVEIVPFFQRAFVQMASADPAWTAAPFGGAGTTTVTLTLDASGHLTGSSLGGGAGAALASSIGKTLAMLAHRSFTATGPRSVLHLTAHVSKDTVHDGLHGNVFAIGVTRSGAAQGASGTAWFALPSGRRVDLSITAR